MLPPSPLETGRSLLQPLSARHCTQVLTNINVQEAAVIGRERGEPFAAVGLYRYCRPKWVREAVRVMQQRCPHGRTVGRSLWLQASGREAKGGSEGALPGETLPL